MPTWKQVIRGLLISSGCLAALPITCNSIFAKKSAAVDDADYEYVTVSGSNIAQRVKKGTKPVTTSPVDEVSKESFEQMRTKLTRSPPPGS